jgi:hypothetical protein
MPKNWPFNPILSTVVLSNGAELLSREGYEFGGYLFHPEEMGTLGQFAGSKLKRFGSQPLLGVANGNITSSSQGSSNSSLYPSHEPKVARTPDPSQTSNGTTPAPVRVKPRGTSRP